jgi:acetyl esterase/lipase
VTSAGSAGVHPTRSRTSIRLRKTFLRLLALSALVCRPLGAQVERNIAYTAGAAASQRLDLYRPSATGAGWPVVLFVHGGSLSESGERRTSPMYADVCPALAARGIVCATMDYRLWPTNRWPSMPNDVAAATRWLRDSVAGRGGDPKHLVIVGHSSGCFLAAMIATDSSYLAHVRLTTRDLAGVALAGCMLTPWDTIGTGLTPERVRAAFAHDATENTLFSSVDERLSANPTRHLGPHVPPTLIIVAEAERFTPPILEQGAAMVRRLHELGAPADIRILAGRRHITTTTHMREPGDPFTEMLVSFVHDPIGYVGRP